MKNNYIKFFTDFGDYKKFVLLNRRNKKLHSLAEPNLKYILKEIYPESHPINEINVDGGRVDLIFYLSPIHSIHFEIFASKGQVDKDTLLLERSPSDIKIAILIDDEIDPKVSKKFFRTNPDPFIHFNLSQIFMKSKIDNFKREIGNLIKPSRLKPNSQITSLRNSLLRCYEAIKKLCYFKFDLDKYENLNHKDEIEKSLTLLNKYKEELSEYLDFHFDPGRLKEEGFRINGMNRPAYKITLDRVKIEIFMNVSGGILIYNVFLQEVEFGMVLYKADLDSFLNELKDRLNF